MFSPEGPSWREPERVRAYLEGKGFVDARIEVEERKSELENYRVFVGMFPGSLGMVVNHCWTEEERGEWKGRAKGYAEEFLRERYGEFPSPKLGSDLSRRWTH